MTNLIAIERPVRDAPHAAVEHRRAAAALRSRRGRRAATWERPGTTLIQPLQLNQAQPQNVVSVGVLNAARPYIGYGNIQMRQTTAKSRYHGMLVSFRHDQGRAGLLNLSYTLSRTDDRRHERPRCR